MADKLDGLIFSEFLVDNAAISSGYDTDGDGQANKSDEFIELQNTTGSPIALDGYELWSDDNGLLYAFGPGDTVDPGGTATLVGEYSGSAPSGIYDAGRSDGDNWLEDGEGSRNDSIYLVNTATGQYISFSYGDPVQAPSPPPGFPGTSQLGSGEAIDSGAPNGVGFVRDADGAWVEGAPNPGSPGVPCFTSGTLILTPQGEQPVETLQVGDLVVTRDSGPQPIRWMASQCLGPDHLAARPELRPIVLEARWTGGARRTLLSPQHGVFVRTSDFPAGRLVRAMQLARLNGGSVRIARGIKTVRYVHFLLPHHEIVYSNGFATESFYPGPRAVTELAPLSRLSLLALVPGQRPESVAKAYGPPKVPYAKWRDLPDRLSDLSVEPVLPPCWPAGAVV